MTPKQSQKILKQDSFVHHINFGCIINVRAAKIMPYIKVEHIKSKSYIMELTKTHYKGDLICSIYILLKNLLDCKIYLPTKYIITKTTHKGYSRFW